MRIAVVGAHGQLGAAIVQACAQAHDVRALVRADLDITDGAAVERVIDALAPDAVVNCTGFNDVDAAEGQPVEALNVNALAVRALARAAESAGAIFVHYSTDFVFDGRTTVPYTEEDRPNPLSAYAASKLTGEWFALDGSGLSGPPCYVVRVESLFGSVPGGRVHGSVHGIYTAVRERRSVKVFSDRTISPTFVIDAAAATRALLEKQPARGIYHCVSSGSCTWLELAHEMARLMGREPLFEPVTLDQVPTPARRPLFSALSNRKLAAAVFEMPAWQDALARYVQTSA